MSVTDDYYARHRAQAMQAERSDVFCASLADCDMPRHDTEHLQSSATNEARLARSIASLDAVNQPSHYARFIIEPATFNAANGLSFLEGNVVKYTVRAPYKGKRLEDLRKARRCLDMLIETAERDARIEAGESAEDVWKVML
jgi:hypothetical protein